MLCLKTIDDTKIRRTRGRDKYKKVNLWKFKLNLKAYFGYVQKANLQKNKREYIVN